MKFLSAFFFLITIPAIIYSQSTFFTGGNICANGEWKLSFQDEFNDNILDDEAWYTYYPCNDDWSVPCEEARVGENHLWLEENVVESNGTLKLVARKETATWVSTTRNYTSGLIFSSSSHRFPAGKFEMYCKVPSGKGLFPSFWLFGGDEDGNALEIDIFEFQGDNPNYFHPGMYKYDHAAFVAHDDCDFESIDFSLDWHLYSVEWDPFFTIFKIDNEAVCFFSRFYTLSGKEVDWCCLEPGVYNKLPAYPSVKNTVVSIIAGLGIGSDDDAPNNNTVFPATFEIDYIRVYQRDTSMNSENDCEVLLYPNPAADHLSIRKNRMTYFKILNAIGQTLMEGPAISKDITVDIRDLQSGIYFVEVQSADGTFANKFVKQ